MRWAKVALIAIGALIAFIVLESVFRLLQWAIIALVIGAIIAIAVKARSQYRLARERRAQVREQKAERKGRVTERPAGKMIATPEWHAVDNVPTTRRDEPVPTTRRDEPVAATRHADVEDDLARLKRELGAQ
jgi:membrane protein implicated in regulation of membrane protease activity